MVIHINQPTYIASCSFIHGYGDICNTETLINKRHKQISQQRLSNDIFLEFVYGI